MQSDEYKLIHPQLHLPKKYTRFNLKYHVQTLLHLQLAMALLLQSSMHANHLNILGTTLQVG